jgi:phenylacetic acid degradation operon negative regulatory protein
MSKERNVTLLDRPLGPRSLVLSLLLRTPGQRMPGARLVQWCSLFGAGEGATRVALSRMVDRGELRSRDGVYELAGRVGRRRPAQDWSINPKLRSWRGVWRSAVVRDAARSASERSALRDTMRRLRMAELRPGIWTRPDNLPPAAAPPDAWEIADAQCAWWSGEPDDDPAVLANDLFDGPTWGARADDLSARLRTAGVDTPLADGFVLAAASLAHIRNDPLLPPALGPSREAGDALREAYRSYESAFSTALRAWFRANTSGGPSI